MSQIIFKITIFVALVTIFSCSDPALIGSELLSEDQVNLKFTDEVPISARTVSGDIVKTYSPFSQNLLQLKTQLVGSYKDPIFGLSEASIYTQIALGPQARPVLTSPQFDSIVLSIAYDPLKAGYGNLNETYGLEVLLLDEDMVNFEDYFSDQTFVATKSIGSVEFVPSTVEKIILNNYTGDSTVLDTVLPHIRIPLSGEFGQMILQDTSLFLNDTTFQNFFKGMHIRPTKTTGGILNLDFTQSISRISLYYKNTKGEQQNEEYRFDFNGGNARVVNLSNNYEGTIVEEFQNSGSDSLLFLQGMVGVNSEITFPDLSAYKNIVVNKAELEFTVASYSVEDSIYHTSNQIIVTTKESGELDVIVDVRSAFFSTNPIRTDIFGGIPIVETKDGVTLIKYKVNLSAHFQQMIEGNVGNTFNISTGIERPGLYFRALPKASDPTRTVFYGPNHPLYPLKLNLTYTVL